MVANANESQELLCSRCGVELHAIVAPNDGRTVYAGPDEIAVCSLPSNLHVPATVECAICGDPHAERSHGDPLVMRELHQRTLAESVEVFADDAADILGRDPNGRYLSAPLRKLVREFGEHTDDEREEYAQEYLDDIDSILSDAGYFPVTDSYQGTWSVYGPQAASRAACGHDWCAPGEECHGQND